MTYRALLLELMLQGLVLAGVMRVARLCDRWGASIVRRAQRAAGVTSPPPSAP